MKWTYFCLVLLILSSCDKRKIFDGPNTFFDDFESVSEFDDLFPESKDGWIFSQQTLEGNVISVDPAFSRSGNNSLRFEDAGTSDLLSKSSLAKNNLAFWEGETLMATAWYFLPDNLEEDWLFIMDIEERTAIGAGPGIRLAIVEGKLLVEHKYLEPNILQPEETAIDFPIGEWVEVSLELNLSQRGEGIIRVWQQGVLIIEQENWNTLPVDILYFQQGTKGMYNSLEIGLTANPTSQALTMWVDDVLIEKTE